MSSMDLGVLMSGLLWICCEMLFLFSTSWLRDITRHPTDTFKVHVVYITHCSKFAFSFYLSIMGYVMENRLERFMYFTSQILILQPVYY
ncbi:hypothetical protein P167DRAFT_34238 [Morchella conica CCBAS932]|uniref:Uncharacterized protein n=1 Tax=Morchella conica CCBAS932 TaxID=1392247 RepID=A0A3N4K8G1_9PEZI|nr:hypothetical protein P167DRAFT_34238 [Morchella conica CCBAS932]